MNIVDMKTTEFMQIVPAVMPIDLNSAAQNGDWISLKNYHRLAVVVLCSAATGSPASEDFTVTLRQATNVAGAGAKALNFTAVESKEGALLTAIGAYTENTQTAANTYTVANNVGYQQLYVIDILPETLDKDNNFDCVQVQLSQMASEKVGTAFYLAWGPRYGAAPALLPSAIVN